MKINVQYLEDIGACDRAVIYFCKKFGNNDFDLLDQFRLISDDWKVWFLGCAGIEQIQFLLDNGVNVNVTNIYDCTPLHLACDYNKYENVKCLLQFGANCSLKNYYGNIPIDYVRNEKIRNLLISKRA